MYNYFKSYINYLLLSHLITFIIGDLTEHSLITSITEQRLFDALETQYHCFCNLYTCKYLDRRFYLVESIHSTFFDIWSSCNCNPPFCQSLSVSIWLHSLISDCALCFHIQHNTCKGSDHKPNCSLDIRNIPICRNSLYNCI